MWHGAKREIQSLRSIPPPPPTPHHTHTHLTHLEVIMITLAVMWESLTRIRPSLSVYG